MHHKQPEIHHDHRNGAFVVITQKVPPDVLSKMSSPNVLVGDAKYGSRLGTIAGGGIDPDETSLGAAMREGGEEFGIVIHADGVVPWGLFSQRAWQTDKTGKRIPGSQLVDGLLSAFAYEGYLAKSWLHENKEVGNQRFEPLWKIFQDGNARYGISCLRVLVHYWNWVRVDRSHFEANKAMKDVATTEILTPHGVRKTFSF
jgi:8-oxo-dGTP pyrophosphatase MutT (NUDIX family)